MVSIAELRTNWDINPDLEYVCEATLNLYDAPTIERLATQAVTQRQLRILSLPLNPDSTFSTPAVQVCLCEDDYPGWIALEDLDLLQIADAPYEPPTLTEAEIQARLPDVMAYTYAAMKQPNHYLWGGTVGPNYDCSGLMQTAFLSAGVWLPRDAYQQEAFTQPISLDELQPGDLIFFGPVERANHVGLYLGDGLYVHSSGKDKGRNGIALDRLAEDGDAIGQAYFHQRHGAGRVVASYLPRPRPTTDNAQAVG